MSDPVTMAIAGAGAGALMDRKNPLRGAAIGGLGGYFGGPALMGGANAAAPAALGAGTGLIPPAGAALTMGSGSAALGTGAAGLTPGAAGMTGMTLSPQMASGALMPNFAPAGASLLSGKDALDLGMKGVSMMMNDPARQQQPRPIGAPMPAPRPAFAPGTFLNTGPMFQPVAQMPIMNQPVAPNPRFRNWNWGG